MGNWAVAMPRSRSATTNRPPMISQSQRSKRRSRDPPDVSRETLPATASTMATSQASPATAGCRASRSLPAASRASQANGSASSSMTTWPGVTCRNAPKRPSSPSSQPGRRPRMIACAPSSIVVPPSSVRANTPPRSPAGIRDVISKDPNNRIKPPMSSVNALRANGSAGAPMPGADVVSGSPVAMTAGASGNA